MQNECPQMAFEQFCLKWNNFQSNILTAFESLQSTEDLADVTLACDGTTLKAHKFILSACSPYFRNIFKENPCPHPVVILKDVRYSDLIALLNFMYHGEVMVTKEQLQTFLKTAEALQVSGLKSLPDLCQKMRNQHQHQHHLPEEPPEVHHEPRVKRARREEDPKKVSEEMTPKQQNHKLVQEPIPLEKIKVEVEEEVEEEEENSTDGDATEHISKDGKSLLEAALVVKEKEVPSILERSLTSSVLKVSEVNAPATHKPPPPPDEAKKDIVGDGGEGSDHTSTNSNDSSVGNGGENSGGIVPPVHHSSQCGTCPHCGRPFNNQSSLKYHVRLVHSELSNLYCCHLCPLTFGFRYGYKKHMADVHSVRT